MISVYIHIPFCHHICSYCDFCKMYYQKSWVNLYLEALEKEINKTYKGEKVRTLYIGGGTPSLLTIDELKILFEIVNKLDLSSLEEFTIEANIEDINDEKLSLFKEYNINRLSIGIQSFNSKLLKFLNRHYNKQDIIKAINLAKAYFQNLNVDLIYGIPNQTIRDLKEDLNQFLNLNISHISTYSLIIEEHTKLYIDKIKALDEDINYEMYELINKTLKKHHFKHYEISNYAKESYESKHNLTYWNNEHYYGFGLGASSYINKYRYDNTRSFTNYVKGKYIKDKHLLSKKEMMENEMILGLRKLEGVSKEQFYHKYKQRIEATFKVKEIIKSGNIIDKGNYLYIPEDKLFISNDILINFID